MENCKELVILSVSTTVSSVADAQALARRIVAEKLGACVQVEAAVLSFYRWQGQQCEDPEVRLTIKTLPSCAGALQALFAQAHPYEVPQFLTVTMQASQAYFDWVRGEVVDPIP
ncbi:MAG: periplasmic divalent cation tolerance protein-like protein [Ramlibacter sp.]|jgi:periplasmic divalent cation tolerance protein|nr:periplasmic divalent cation tolerance protein-like protein [Ramlibacter sp.]